MIKDYAMAAAIEKTAKTIKEDLKEDTLAQLQESNITQIRQNFEGGYVTVSRVSKTKFQAFERDEFLDFMNEKGMLREVVDSDWTKYVEKTEDGTVVWASTGEVVPCAWATEDEYITARVSKDLVEQLRIVDLPRLEAGHERA